MSTFQELIRNLSVFWEKQGCIVHQGYDLEVGAGTSNPATFLRCLGPEPYKAAYVEPSRRPTDGRFGTNPNRLQHYFQFQVILKPSPPDIQNVYLQSLEAIGLKLNEHDIRFVHDDWEQPTLGAAGLGWEAWCDGMEVSQITYFQTFAGIDVKPVTGEITYGLERLAMYLQNVSHFTDIKWNDKLTYGDIYLRNEQEWSAYNFDHASKEMWLRHFQDYENEALRLIERDLPLPAYDFVIKSSHAFNILDARGAISVTERTGYIARIRNLACQIAQSYIKSREKLGFPLLKHLEVPKHIPKNVEEKKSTSVWDAAKSGDFLLEIGSEELPATFVPVGMANLEKALKQLLDKESLSFSKLEVFGTPRRLAIRIEQLPFSKPAQTIERKGPPLTSIFDDKGQLNSAGEGFFRSLNLEPLSLQKIKNGERPEIEIRSIKGIDYIWAKLTSPAKMTADILIENLPKLILNLEFPKKMRWSDLDVTFARPILWVVALFGEHIVPFTVAQIPSGNQTRGHRQLDPGALTLSSPSQYVEELRKHKVLVDVQERKSSILTQLDKVEKEIDAQIIERPRVLAEVLNLVEWPMVTVADFDAAFLRAPKELLISEMVEHQRYFPVVDKQGKLKNQFIITANNTPSNQIRQGNQKVLSARLSDGVFLYEQDLKSSLDAFNEKLAHVAFQKELGTVFDKVQRIVKHVETLHRFLKMGDLSQAKRAALLCKADLASAAVYEFPELQGIMGRVYAEKQNEAPAVASAIEEHWMPRGENAPLPASDIGLLVSLADKIDNLIGCFAVGLKPTSSSDPYALRRQVLGMIRMLCNRSLFLPLADVFQECMTHFPTTLALDKKQIWEEIQSFIAARLKTYFQEAGVEKDVIEAGLALGVQDINDTYLRIQALSKFRKTAEFGLLYEVYKRAKGQINTTESLALSSSLLKEPAEQALNEFLVQTDTHFSTHLQKHAYDIAYHSLAELQPGLAKLFDEVKILDDDARVRQNRIALLQRVFNRFGLLLDFSKIQDKKSV